MSETTLDATIDELYEIWDLPSEPTPKRCHELMERLAASDTSEPWLADFWSDDVEGRELYRSPTHGFLLLMHRKRRGDYVPPHDHGKGWVVYAVQSGAMTLWRYDRRAEGEVERREEETLHGGECRVYLQGDIHDTLCTSDAVLLRLTSCDVFLERAEGRMVTYTNVGGGGS